MSRAIQDLTFTTSKALPAANANNDTSSFNLVQVAPGVELENVELMISVPALPALVEAKTLTISIQDSADDSSYATIAGLATLVITGGVGGGAAAATRYVRLPRGTRRYLRFNQAVMNGGGDNTGVSVTYKLLF
jgi:hypothetical protein